MSAAQVIANYQALSALTGKMRDAAMRGEWDDLIAIEQQRGKLVASMKPLDSQARLDEATRQRKNALITEVLAADAEIREGQRHYALTATRAFARSTQRSNHVDVTP